METLQRFTPLLGIVLLLVAAVNSLVMFEVLGRRTRSQNLRSFHRVLGWIYLAGLAGFFVYMFPRGAELPSLTLLIFGQMT